MRKILLDANTIILFMASLNQDSQHVQDPKELEENQLKIQKLKDLLSNPDVALAITPLIRYEVLRGAKDKFEYQTLESILEEFEEFDINKDIGELSACIFKNRFESLKANQSEKQKEAINMLKRSFDICHFASAKCNKLEFLSNDDDIEKYKSIYNDIINKETRWDHLREHLV